MLGNVNIEVNPTLYKLADGMERGKSTNREIDKSVILSL